MKLIIKALFKEIDKSFKSFFHLPFKLGASLWSHITGLIWFLALNLTRLWLTYHFYLYQQNSSTEKVYKIFRFTVRSGGQITRYPMRSSRRDILWVSSAKEISKTGPIKYAFSVGAPSL